MQSMQCRHTSKDSDCWLDCCYLTGASCCSVDVLPADIWQADDTCSQAPWDIACPTSTDEPALKGHLIHQQCTPSGCHNSQHQKPGHTYMQTGKLNNNVGKPITKFLPTRMSVNRALPPIVVAQVLMSIAYVLSVNASLILWTMHAKIKKTMLQFYLPASPGTTSGVLCISRYHLRCTLQTSNCGADQALTCYCATVALLLLVCYTTAQPACQQLAYQQPGACVPALGTSRHQICRSCPLG